MANTLNSRMRKFLICWQRLASREILLLEEVEDLFDSGFKMTENFETIFFGCFLLVKSRILATSSL